MIKKNNIKISKDGKELVEISYSYFFNQMSSEESKSINFSFSLRDKEINLEIFIPKNWENLRKITLSHIQINICNKIIRRIKIDKLYNSIDYEFENLENSPIVSLKKIIPTGFERILNPDIRLDIIRLKKDFELLENQGYNFEDVFIELFIFLVDFYKKPICTRIFKLKKLLDDLFGFFFLI